MLPKNPKKSFFTGAPDKVQGDWIIKTVCGANDRVAIADTAEQLKNWINPYVNLPFGIPSPDTFTSTFGAVLPMLVNWTAILDLRSNRAHVQKLCLSPKGWKCGLRLNTA
jgi:hypothetical protein